MSRFAAVAGRFYPDDPIALKKVLARLVPAVRPSEKLNALAVILPHAGYIYSGATAGKTISKVQVPQTVVMLGPNHYGLGASVALATQDWDMPMRKIPVEQEFCRLLFDSCEEIKASDIAHEKEHSLEVQLPFLHFCRPDVRIVPLSISHIPYTACVQIAQALAQAVKSWPQPVLLVASTDMTHYTSRKQAAKQDQLAIDRILEIDPEGLFSTVSDNDISMCGVLPVTITLLAVKYLGATQVKLVEYTDSGAVSGDTDQVVGYAGLIVN
ncbi:MAG: AmmeMemoRadiSam system protein B [Desulfobulbus propionicus]|nr:MAG: AmmeMemoRadiSam system protein B [Desulfobulbus propionicus]